MPCDSSYLAPRGAEIESRRVGRLLVWLGELIGQEPPVYARAAAEHVYGSPRDLDRMTDALCTTIRNLPKDARERVLYNGKDKRSRALADWWEEHEKHDFNSIVNWKVEL